jgi:hypothetical protein
MDYKFVPAPRDTSVAADAAQIGREGRAVGFSLVRAWQERRHAGKSCLHLRALHEQISRAEPDLKGVLLYSRVVQRYLGCDQLAADRLLGDAQASYSDWPQVRALTFRDVAHYLTAIELCQGPKADGWIESDLRRTFARFLPSHW